MSDEEGSEASPYILCVIDSLKKKITADRFTSIKNRIEENRIKLITVTQSTSNSSKIWQINTPNGTGLVSNLLTSGQDDVLCSVHSHEVPAAEDVGVSSEEESSNDTSTVMFGGKLIRPIQLPEVPKILPYTTWTFLDMNQRMSEDQSVLGRRRIYYDANCAEALICSDSEDEAVENEEEKKEFKVSEDFLIL